ncbi:MAG: hypothetical protein ABW075_04950 [Aeromicrobium sp.]
MRMAALSLLLVLAACGGSDESPSTDASTPAASAPVASPTVAPPTGDPVPEALSGFRCEPDGAGAYRASGALKNATKASVTFHVTVHVGTPSAAPQSAKTTDVPTVKGGASVQFAVDGIPAPAEGGTCHVQVLTAK